MQPIVRKLTDLIALHRWGPNFDDAIKEMSAHAVPSMAAIRCLDDYLRYLDDMVCWAPRERGDSRLVHDKLVEFYFLLNQPSLRHLQNEVVPAESPVPLTSLSRWIGEFAAAWGEYLDTPESAVHIDSFRTNPAFHWDDYMSPPSGYRTFNQFFARHVKPGARRIESLNDDAVIVSPADATFIGSWPVDDDGAIHVEPTRLNLKGLRWSIHQLLNGSRYAHRFAGGVFMHTALRTFDFHRWHTPVAGTVLETRIVQGQTMLDVAVLDTLVCGKASKHLQAVEGTGFQFVQTRGLVVLASPIGLVACLPIGMAQVSSVVITAEPGVTLHKGEEMGYFQFGGSDFVLVFEADAQVSLSCCADQHYPQGRAIGRSHRPQPA